MSAVREKPINLYIKKIDFANSKHIYMQIFEEHKKIVQYG